MRTLELREGPVSVLEVLAQPLAKGFAPKLGAALNREARFAQPCSCGSAPAFPWSVRGIALEDGLVLPALGALVELAPRVLEHALRSAACPHSGAGRS